MDARFVFLLGLAGAIAPEIVRLYSIRTNPAEFHWSWFYLLISILFAGLGGVVALILPATTYYGAFYAGITTPVLINTAVKRTRGKPDRKKSAVPPKPGAFESFIDGL